MSLVGMCFRRWNEVTRRIEMWISILELNELGEYAAVELHQAKDVNTGGVFQLRQVPPVPLLASCFLSVPHLHTGSGGFLVICLYLPYFFSLPVSSAPHATPFLIPAPTSASHPASAGSFPESASHSETCPAFRDTTPYGRSHPVHLHRLCDCQVHQAPERAGQLPGETPRLEIVSHKDGLMEN